MRPSAIPSLLLVVILLLGGLLALEINRPDIFVHRLAGFNGTASGTEPVSTDPSHPQPVRKMPGEETFAAISTRPLFSPTRRPPEESSETPVSATSNKPPSFVLTGIVSTAERSAAIFEPIGKGRRNGTALIVHEGDTVDGWTVEAIEAAARRVILTKGGERLEMEQKANESRRRKVPRLRTQQPGAPKQPGTEQQTE